MILKNTCEWKKVNIKEYEDCYLVSNTGEVYSLHRNKTLKPKMTREGYLKVTLCNGHGKQKVCGIHRLVALTFIPNPEKKPTVNHIDEDKTNNNASNLEWMTNAEQNIHGTRIERAKSHTDYKNRGIDYKEVARKHDYTKPSMCNRKRCAVFDKRGNLLGIFSTQKEAGAKYNVHTSKVSACISGQIKSSKGFIFKRIEEDWGKIV